MARALPHLRVNLRPNFDTSHDNTVSSISITLHIKNLNAKAGAGLLTLPLNRGNVPSARYDGDALTATDKAGALQLSKTDTAERNATRTWTPERDPVGDIIVAFEARPREVEPETSSTSRIDLRADQGGLVGPAFSFIPWYPGDEDVWDIIVEWEIPPSAPAGTRVACSMGDGLSHRLTGVPSDVISRSLFAVGPLQRSPPWEDANAMGLAPQQQSKGEQALFMYWFGSSPYDMARVSSITENLFRAVAGFFGDHENDFRVFMRRVHGTHGGRGSRHSFMLEYYSPGIEEEQTEEDLIALLSHEMVHEYPLPYPMRFEDAWYSEGLANYYACTAPFYGGVVSREFLKRMLNRNAQAYYTSSTINLEWQYVLDHYSDNFEITKCGYHRGFIYLAQIQGLVSRATGGEKGVDDLVLELYRRQLAQEKCQGDDLVDLLGGYVGKAEAEATFQAMKSGKKIVPLEDCFAKFGLKLAREDAEKFEAGFDPNSLRTKKIKDLVKGSRAEQAGVREGDEVIRSWMLWGASDSLDGMMQLTVKRENGGEQIIRYWPRSYQKVENWIWVDSDKS